METREGKKEMKAERKKDIIKTVLKKNRKSSKD
jgi:hypothetical protein